MEQAAEEDFGTIARLLARQSKAHGPRIAIETTSGDALTYEKLHAQVESLAASIAAACPQNGGRPRIGIALANGLRMAITMLGVCRVGVAVPFNPAYRRGEFEDYFRATNVAAVVVASGDEDGPAAEAARHLGIGILAVTEEGALAASSSEASNHIPEPGGDDLAVVLLTSGSTGRSKAVPLTHTNLCISARDVCRSMALTPDDRCLVMWEQYHIGGLVDLLLAPLASAGTVVLTDGFAQEEFFRLLPEMRPTWFQAVPAVLSELVFHSRRASLTPRPNTLRLIRSVAAALPPKLMAEVDELFGAPVIQTFGMTEAGPLITSTRLPPASRKPGSVGTSCGTRIAVFGPDLQPLGAGEVGQVAIRGANVFSGYENDPEANASQFRRGWFFTGDLGYIDWEGDLFLTGRIKQLINRGGEKINPQEVDDALLDHADVSEAASFAVPHRTLGEDIAAAVVLRDGALAGEREVREFLTGRLASFKIPRRIAILTHLPRNPVGKVDRMAVAEVSQRVFAQNVEANAKPEDALEEFLVALWSAELDLDSVGLDDDFSVVGGDSLSSLRIHLAVEKTFGLIIDEDAFNDLTTIRSMAAFLRRSGGEADRMATGATPLSRRDLNARKSLSEIGIGTSGATINLGASFKALNDCRRMTQFRALTDAITLYCTPDELEVQLEQHHSQSVGERLAGLASSVMAPRLGWARRNWRRRLEAELAAGQVGASWSRHEVSENAFLYRGGGGTPSRKTLVVGFSGNLMRLLIPTYRILMSLDPAQVDLLLLRDPSQHGFSQGVPGLGSDLDGIARYLSAFAERERYADCVTLGTSAGGLAAIDAALSNGWGLALAVGADAPERHSVFPQRWRRMLAGQSPVQTHVNLCFGAKNERDSAAARSIAELLPCVSLFPDARFRTHNLLNRLQQSGELSAFFSERLRPSSTRNNELSQTQTAAAPQ